MKQVKFVLLLMAVIAVTAIGYIGLQSFSFNKDEYSSLLLQNIEALSNNEGNIPSCTGPKLDGECQCINARPCRDFSGCQ